MVLMVYGLNATFGPGTSKRQARLKARPQRRSGTRALSRGADRVVAGRVLVS